MTYLELKNYINSIEDFEDIAGLQVGISFMKKPTSAGNVSVVDGTLVGYIDSKEGDLQILVCRQVDNYNSNNW